MFPYFRSASQTIRSWFARRKTQPAMKKMNAVQLRVETLEDRFAPSAN